MKNSRRAKFIVVGLALLVVPIMLLLIEGAVRIFRPRLDPLEVFIVTDEQKMQTQDRTTTGMFEYDPLLTWRPRANLRGIWWDYTNVSTNRDHLRLDHEVGPKTPGTVRIITLGDSVTFGYRVPVVLEREKPTQFDKNDFPYFQLLQQRLGAAFPGKSIEVIPLACPGYTSHQGLAWLERDIAKYEPDMVLACFGWNDVSAAGLADRDTMPSSKWVVLTRRVICQSQGLLYLARSMSEKRAATPGPPPAPQARTSDQEYVTNFLQMAAVAKAHRAWFGVLLPVYRDPSGPGWDPEHPEDIGVPDEGKRMTHYRNELRANLQAHQIPFLEIPELTEANWPASNRLFGERIHPNADGHRLMAERLEGFLTPFVSERLKK